MDTPKILQYSFSVLAIMSASIGLLILSVWYTATNPQLYIGALEEAGVYTQITEITEEYAAVAIEGLSEEIFVSIVESIFGEVETTPVQEGVISIAYLTIGSIIEQNTPEVISAISNALRVEQVISETSNEIIVNSLIWLKGESKSPEVFNYIPDPLIVETMENEGVIKIATLYISAEALGISNLPACQTPELEQATLYSLNQGNLDGVTCTSDTIKPILFMELENSIAGNLATELQTLTATLLEKYNLTPVVDTVFELVKGLSVIKYGLIQFQSFVQAVRYSGIVLLGFSLLAVVIALIFTEKNRHLAFFKMTFTTGMVMIFVSVFYLLAGADTLVKSFNFNSIDISNEVISPARNILLIQSLENAATIIAEAFFMPTFHIGALISILSITFILIILVWQKRNDKRLQMKIEDLTKRL